MNKTLLWVESCEDRIHIKIIKFIHTRNDSTKIGTGNAGHGTISKLIIVDKF